MKPDQYGAFLTEIFDEWVRRAIGDIFICPSYRAFFHHIDHPMHKMANLLHRGRKPADIMDIGRWEKSV